MSLSVDQTLRKAMRLSKKGETDLAAQQFRIVLDKYPQNKRAIAGLKALQQLPQKQIDGLIALYEQGNLQQVLVQGAALGKQFPDSPFIPNLLAEVNTNMGRFKQAAANYAEALKLDQNNAQSHNNLGIVLNNLGCVEEAVASFSKAVQIKPGYVEAHINLGNRLKDFGRLEEAVASYRKVLQLKPDFAEVHNNLGVALQDLGKSDEAVMSYTKALQLNPDIAEAQNNLGAALYDLGKTDEAIAVYAKALQLRPNYAQANNNMGVALNNLGKTDEAIVHFQKSVFLSPANKEFWLNFSEMLRTISLDHYDEQLANTFLAILDQGTVVRPAYIARSILSYLKCHSTFQTALNKSKHNEIETSALEACVSLSGVPLLLRVLELSPVPDQEVEKLLNTLRRVVLIKGDMTLLNETALPFQQALALHCFTNEYVFGESREEISAIQALEADIERSLAGGEQPIPFAIACFASYRPLHSVEWAEQLEIPPSLEKLFERQLKQPREEAALRPNIRSMGQISDQVSQTVRAQYEENPYPRWINTALPITPASLRVIANSLRLKVNNEAADFVVRPEILIAGCGTGQQALIAATRFLNSNVLAIDLSLSSLSYAIRKTEELGINNIDYLQADILNLDKLEKQFDLIESVGVLHHMMDPMAGWSILRDRLKPGGLMKVALYSEFARKTVVEARLLISEKGLSHQTRDILNFRTAILGTAREQHSDFSGLLNFSDFYSTSEFRDLLFHVQEHRFTLPKIKENLEVLGLKFAGFEFRDNKITKRFEQTYPDPQAIYDLDIWHEFEMENTDTFAGMYQLWMQQS